MSLWVVPLVLLHFHGSKGCSDETNLIFSQDYNRLQAPFAPNKTTVNVSLWIDSFDGVDDSQKTLTISTWIVLNWQDNRIQMKPGLKQIGKSNKSKSFFNCIWAPNLFFFGMISSSHTDRSVPNQQDIIMENIDNTSIRITYNFHLQVKIICPEFDFHWFPFDRQFCSIILRRFKRDSDVELNGQVDFAQHMAFQFCV